MESSSIPSEALGAPPAGQDLTAVESRVTALERRVDALETKGIAGGGPEPTNPGESLSPTPTNPELTPDSPGVEPGDAPAPTPDPVASPTPPVAGSEATPTPATPASGDGAPEPPASQPAAKASELPLYVDVTADRSATWEYTPPFTAAGLITPDGRTLYHYAGDTAGQEGTGAKDGTIGIYADEVVQSPQDDQAAS